MASGIEIVGPAGTLQLFGVRLVGVNAESGKKLLFSGLLVAALLVLRAIARAVTRRVSHRHARGRMWAAQSSSLLLAAMFIIGLASIWFESPARLTTALGLVSAGLAFALQRVVTAFAGYIIILRGRSFTVGDRITMGGVRGDVIHLGFMQTTIMEMGQAPSVAAQADPAMWVASRQYTGRIVTVSNDKLFDTPVYNYTRDFPYIWEEIRLPVPYDADRDRAEAILIAAAKRHELAVRFLVEDHGIRDVKDAMSREILTGLERAQIRIASATLEVVGLPSSPRFHDSGKRG